MQPSYSHSGDNLRRAANQGQTGLPFRCGQQALKWLLWCQDEVNSDRLHTALRTSRDIGSSPWEELSCCRRKNRTNSCNSEQKCVKGKAFWECFNPSKPLGNKLFHLQKYSSVVLNIFSTLISPTLPMHKGKRGILDWVQSLINQRRNVESKADFFKAGEKLLYQNSQDGWIRHHVYRDGNKRRYSANSC